MQVYRNNKKGFTLAEVLITLGIIGVVAAMTIGIIQTVQKREFATSAKKAYSQMNQVLQQMAVDGGTVGDISQYFGTTATAGAKIASYYKVVKNCGTTAGDECFAKFDNKYDGSANSTIIWTNVVSPNYKFATADGMSFAIVSYGNNCIQNLGFLATPDAPVYNSSCGYTYIDINGAKKPNNLGRDIFIFYITNKKTPILYPYAGFYHSDSNIGTATGGGDRWWNYGNASYCGNNAYKGGEYCTGRLIENGWEMDW